MRKKSVSLELLVTHLGQGSMLYACTCICGVLEKYVDNLFQNQNEKEKLCLLT